MEAYYFLMYVSYSFKLTRYIDLKPFSFVLKQLFMCRMYIYLLVNDYRQDFRQFQWLEVLRIEDERTLIRKHHFTAKEASSYLHLIGLFMKFIRINRILYWYGCSSVIWKLLRLAHRTIPLHWFLLSTVPNAAVNLFRILTAFEIYNYFVLIYFANAMFIRKSLRSLVAQRPALLGNKLKKNRMIQLAKRNLLQFNYIIRNFKQSQASFDYTFCYR